MSTKAQAILDEIRALPPQEFQAVWQQLQRWGSSRRADTAADDPIRSARGMFAGSRLTEALLASRAEDVGVAEALVLDTSACFAFLEDEAGADVVESYPAEAKEGRTVIHLSFATLTEVEYIITQERSALDAAAALAKMKAWPIQWLHSDEALCGEAAKLKAAHKVSFADAFVAATAQRLDAMLVHKDPDFDAIKGIIKLHPLPPKPGKTT